MNNRYDLPLVHPGKMILKFMNENNLSQRDLSEKINICESNLSRCINCKRDITIKIAFKLSEIFNTTPEFWIDIQTDFNINIFKNKKLDNKCTDCGIILNNKRNRCSKCFTMHSAKIKRDHKQQIIVKIINSINKHKVII